QAVHGHPKVKDTDALHADIVKLMNDVADQRKRLAMAEDRLKLALMRFQGMHEKKTETPKPPPPSPVPADNRLDLLEKKLEDLRKELQQMRSKERPKSRTNGASQRPAVNPTQWGSRRIELPVKWQPGVTDREVAIYVSADRGKNYE